jgi:hypothetical protein
MKARIGSGLVILIGLTGMILTLVWLIQGNDDPLQFPACLLSMVIVLSGSLTLKDERAKK